MIWKRLCQIIRDRPTMSLFIIAVMFRLMFLAAFGSNAGLPDEQQYLLLAQNIVENHSYGYSPDEGRTHRPPLYPLLITPFVALKIPPAGIVVFHAFVSGFCTILVFKTLERLKRSKLESYAAGLSLALAPDLARRTAFILTDTLGAFFIASLLYLTTYSKRSSKRQSLLCGTVAGLCALLRFELILIATVVLLLNDNVRRRSLYAFATMLLVIAPWVVRNAFVTRMFVPFSSNVDDMGASLAPGATVDSTGDQQWVVNAALSGINDSMTRPQKEVAASRSIFSAALRYSASHPIRTMRLCTERTLYNLSVPAGIMSDGYPWLIVFAAGTFIFWVFVAISLMTENRPPPRYLIAFFIGLAPYAMFIAAARFRIPLLPLATVYFGSGVSAVACRTKLKVSKLFIVVSAILIASYVYITIYTVSNILLR